MFTSLVVQVTFNLSTLFTGLSHTPRPDKAEISFTVGNDETYDAYVNHMGEFLKAYDDDNQENNQFEDCGGT